MEEEWRGEVGEGLGREERGETALGYIYMKKVKIIIGKLKIKNKDKIKISQI